MNTSPCPSVFNALVDMLYRVRNDFLRKNATEPRMRFVIGFRTYCEMMNEPVMQMMMAHSMDKDAMAGRIEIDGVKGEVHDSMPGFAIIVDHHKVN